MSELTNLKVAILATDGVEESELTEPQRALEAAGAEVDLISIKPTEIQAYHHEDKSIQLLVTRVIENVKASEYDALMLPGGKINADSMRKDLRVLAFVKEIHHAGKPIAAICHAPWILISAGLIRGRTLTSYPAIQEDIRNAGGEWVDREVAQDSNWVTSRTPDDLPAFNREMVSLFSRSTPSIIQIAESA